MKGRNSAIDVLKFFAALIITWSHLEPCLPSYKIIATGGAIGDALFFFISGFTLFYGGGKNFPNWYKRRIQRIYPTVFAWALMSSVLLGNESSMKEILLSGGGFFVSCIMIFYIPLYFIKTYFRNHLWLMLITAQVLCMIAYWFVDMENHHYEWTWSFYFVVMLFGAIVGKNEQTLKEHETGYMYFNPVLSISSVVSGIVGYYLIVYLVRSLGYSYLEILYVLPLLLVCHGFFRLCSTEMVRSFMERPKMKGFVLGIGGLCLEIYIVQPSLLTDSLNDLFPLNIILIYLLIIGAAYVLRCLSRIWKQTFSSEEYNWKGIISIY